jgi:hypothetical protein
MHAALKLKKGNSKKESFEEVSSKKNNDAGIQSEGTSSNEIQQLQTLSDKSQQTSGVSQLQEMADQFNTLDQSSEHQENNSTLNNSTIQRQITLEGFQESTKEKIKKRGAGVKKIDALVWRYEKLTKEGAEAQERYSSLLSIEKLITNWNEKHKNDKTGGRVKKLEAYLETIASEKDHVKSEIQSNSEEISSKPQGVEDIEEGIGSFDQQDIETSMKSSGKDVKTTFTKIKESLISPEKKKTGEEKLEEKKDKGLGKSLKGVVMNIQKHHGQMDQFDTFIKGDAAVNSYYSDAAEEVESGDETTALYEQAKGTYLSKMHNKVLNTEEKGFKKSKLKNYKNSSLRDAKKSDTLLAKAKDADGMAQAYYVQHYELGNTRKNLAKRKGSKEKLRKEQRANYVDAKNLLYEVRDNRKKMQERRDGLRAEGRVVTIGGAIWNAVKFGTVAGGIKFLSFGTKKFVPKKDGRGKVSDEKFDLDLETGKSERRIDDGPWVQSLAHQMKDIMAEFWAKIKKRSKTIWGKISAALGSFKKFVELARGVFSATATWLGGLSILLPPMATVFAPISAFLSWLSSLFKGINIGATALKLVADGIANLTNSDPSLFTELRGELYGSVAKGASEGASLGANQAWSEGRKTLNNRNQGEYVQSDLDRFRNGHDKSVKTELDKTTVIDKESSAKNNLFGHKYENRISKTGLGEDAPKGELERFKSMSAKDQEAELTSINSKIATKSVSKEELNQLKLKKNLYENYENTNKTGDDIGYVIGDVTTDIGSDLLNVLPTVGNESMDRNDVNYNQDYDGQQTGKNTKGQKEINIKDAAKRKRLKDALRTLEEKGHEKAKGLQEKLNLFKPQPSLPELTGGTESDKKAKEESNNMSKEMPGVIDKVNELAAKTAIARTNT